MEKFIAFLCLASISVFGQMLPGGDKEVAPLSVEFKDTSDRYYSVGDSASFECLINRGLVYLFTNEMFIIRKDTNGKETELFVRTNRKEADPMRYDQLEMKQLDDGQSQLFTMTIKNITDEDEGELICRIVPNKENNPNDAMTESVVKISMKRKIEQVSLKLGDINEISTSQSVDFEVDAGPHPVMCSARGSNPAVVNLNMYFNDKVINSERKEKKMSGQKTRFETTVKGTVDIKLEDSNQILECRAEQPFTKEGMESMVTVSVPIKVNRYDPVVSCTEAFAYKGLMYPKLTCTIEHAGLDIKHFKYLIKNPEMNKEVTIKAGEVAEDNSEVKIEQNGDTSTVTLVLYSAEDWHFGSEFFMIVENENGYLTQVPVTLTRVSDHGRSSSDPNNGSPLTAASVTLLLLTSLLSAYRML